MNIIIVDKVVVDSLNEMNTTNHKPNVIELTDGRAFVPAKLLDEPLYKGYQKYFEKCQVEQLDDKLIYKQFKTFEDASNKI